MNKTEAEELVQKLVRSAFKAGQNSSYVESLIFQIEKDKALKLKKEIIKLLSFEGEGISGG